MVKNEDQKLVFKKVVEDTNGMYCVKKMNTSKSFVLV